MFIETKHLVKKKIFNGVNTGVAWGEKIMMSFLDLAPHSVVPFHSYPHEQMGMVLEGEFKLTIAGESKLLRKGDAYLVPSGVEHSVKVMGDSARALDIFSPPRDEYK